MRLRLSAGLKYLALPIVVSLLAASCGCATAPPPQRPKPPVTKPPVTKPFNVTLKISGSPNAGATRAVQQAKTTLESVVRADLPDVSGTSGLRCDGRALNTPPTIDDLFIAVHFVHMDGPDGALAAAGPCQLRAGSLLPVTGLMLIDLADVPSLARSGQLEETILHEMIHVMGFGTIWTDKGLLRNPGTSNPQFTGAKANAQWRALGGTGSVPLETGGGAGTQDGHWHESKLGNELMTGYINRGTNPLSRISVGSLTDLGYKVDLSKADRYAIPRTPKAARSAADLAPEGIGEEQPVPGTIRLGPGTEVLFGPEGIIG